MQVFTALETYILELKKIKSLPLYACVMPLCNPALLKLLTIETFIHLCTCYLFVYSPFCVSLKILSGNYYTSRFDLDNPNLYIGNRYTVFKYAVIISSNRICYHGLIEKYCKSGNLQVENCRDCYYHSCRVRGLTNYTTSL